MKTHRSLSDERFLAQLQSTTLDAALFNLEAHLRLAWLHLNRMEKDAAIKETCAQIQHYVKALGASDKFNTTLTIAAVEAVYHFIKKIKAHSFEAFISNCPELTTNFKDLLQTHYSFDIFTSNTAKTNYIAPDLVSFD